MHPCPPGAPGLQNKSKHYQQRGLKNKYIVIARLAGEALDKQARAGSPTAGLLKRSGCQEEASPRHCWGHLGPAWAVRLASYSEAQRFRWSTAPPWLLSP